MWVCAIKLNRRICHTCHNKNDHSVTWGLNYPLGLKTFMEPYIIFQIQFEIMHWQLRGSCVKRDFVVLSVLNTVLRPDFFC